MSGTKWSSSSPLSRCSSDLKSAPRLSAAAVAAADSPEILKASAGTSDASPPPGPGAAAGDERAACCAACPAAKMAPRPRWRGAGRAEHQGAGPRTLERTVNAGGTPGGSLATGAAQHTGAARPSSSSESLSSTKVGKAVRRSAVAERDWRRRGGAGATLEVAKMAAQEELVDPGSGPRGGGQGPGGEGGGTERGSGGSGGEGGAGVVADGRGVLLGCPTTGRSPDRFELRMVENKKRNWNWSTDWPRSRRR